MACFSLYPSLIIRLLVVNRWITSSKRFQKCRLYVKCWFSDVSLPRRGNYRIVPILSGPSEDQARSGGLNGVEWNRITTIPL